MSLITWWQSWHGWTTLVFRRRRVAVIIYILFTYVGHYFAKVPKPVSSYLQNSNDWGNLDWWIKSLKFGFTFLIKNLHGSTDPQKEEEMKYISAETCLDNKLRQIHFTKKHKQGIQLYLLSMNCRKFVIACFWIITISSKFNFKIKT